MKFTYKLLIVLTLMFMANSLFSQYSLWTWGRNDYGLVGNNRAEHEPLPVLVNEDGDWEKVYPYYAIKKDGSLWTWGNRSVNVLNYLDSLSIRLYDDSNWIEVFNSEGGITYAIKKDGSLWTWGYWNNGWIITENSELHEENNLFTIPLLVDSTHNWDYITFDRDIVFGVDKKGRLFTWGKYRIDMGIGERDYDSLIDKITQVGLDSDWKKVINKDYSTFGLKEDGSIWFWGFDSKALLGDTNEIYYEPLKLLDNSFIDIFSNELGLVCLDSSGSLFSIGEYFRSAQELKLEFAFKNFKFGKCQSNSFSLFKDNKVFLWGINIGLKFTNWIPEDDYFFPELLNNGNDISISEGIIDIAQVRNGFVLIDTNNNLQAWGDNSNADLTNGMSSYYSEPINIVPNKKFIDISCGLQHSLAIDEDGMLWGWGINEDSQLGLNEPKIVYKPILINRIFKWKKVFTPNWNSNFAITSDGALWGWGDNENGKLGVGHEDQVLKPTRIAENGPWKYIVSSEAYTLGLKEDGSLWTWGVGTGRGLGGGLSWNWDPKRIGLDNDWEQMACGSAFSIALKKDGTLWGWGSNYTGFLGDSTIPYFFSPKKLDNTIGEIDKIGASKTTVYFILRNGEFKVWEGGTYRNIIEKTNEYRNLSISNSLKSSYIDRNGKLYLWDERSGNVGPNTMSGFTPDNWIKVTGGGGQYLGLRGDYITNVREPRKLVEADIYPNPSVSNINIDFDSFYSIVNVSIYDVYGKLVIEDKSYNTDRITLNHNLPHGAYILQCRDENELIVDQVLVVE